MAILVDKNTRVLVQGIAGLEGRFHTEKMIDYGTRVVAGVDPAIKDSEFHGVPLFRSIARAKEAVGEFDASVIFVPAPFVSDAVYESVAAGISLITIITEGVPVKDMLRIFDYTRAKGVRVIGPNCPGIITVDECKMGIMPGHIHKKGSVGVISRSGTLTYEVVYSLVESGLGQSTCVGVGGDPVIGTNFVELLEMFARDEQTEGVVLIGEIGGNDEALAAQYIRKSFDKPVVSFIAGRTAPPERRMGHAGAIVGSEADTAEAKIRILENAGVSVAQIPTEIGPLMAEALS
ncbi:MAG: succinate--CoA ligase subunit alpha [Planctomycetota bacterium]|nr:succinate--CoA ligase subunit alpha [Planctomycetota bacterium]